MNLKDKRLKEAMEYCPICGNKVNNTEPEKQEEEEQNEYINDLATIVNRHIDDITTINKRLDELKSIDTLYQMFSSLEYNLFRAVEENILRITALEQLQGKEKKSCSNCKYKPKAFCFNLVGSCTNNSRWEKE